MKSEDEAGQELIILKLKLISQCEQYERLAAQLVTANAEIGRQREEDKKRTQELILANIELAFQRNEKEKRAAEFAIARIELAFQNHEKGSRALELILANKELIFQNDEKEKRAAELIIANKELAFQNVEKEKRAAELVVANKELALQNEAEAKRAAALVVANKELIFQNKEKEKRAAELAVANKELKQFAYIASHDLQEPLRTISNYIEAFEQEFFGLLDENAREYIRSINGAANRMRLLVDGLLDFSRIGRDKKPAIVDCKKIISAVLEDLHTLIKTSKATIDVVGIPILNVYETEMRQLFQNLITNAIKFRKKENQIQIQIRAEQLNDKWKFSVSDNGIGISSDHFERVFDLFQRLHTREKYAGNGIGLANCKKIVQLHRGEIWIESILGQGSTFHFTIPIQVI